VSALLSTDDCRPAEPGSSRSTRVVRTTFALLSWVLPPGTQSRVSALAASIEAFGLVDRWLHLSCSEVLASGLDEGDGTGRLTRVADSALSKLLCSSYSPDNWTGIELVKALLLAGVFAGRAESGLIATLADGARKALKRSDWKVSMPRRLAASATFEEARRHCQEHVELSLGLRGDAAPAGAHREWLLALERWCGILAARP
jgi:hypothetical protein